MSDTRSGIHCADGIDPADAHRHTRETGSLKGLAGCSGRDQRRAPDVTLRHPDPRGSRENQLRDDNARDVQARLIVELANGPTTPAADAVLHARKISVLPDILANAGGVTISYDEWVQTNENEQWDEDEVNGKLERIMTKAADDVIEKQTKINGSLVDVETERQRLGRATIRWTLSIYGRPRSSWLLRRWRGWRSVEGSGRRRASAITRLGACGAAARSTPPCPGWHLHHTAPRVDVLPLWPDLLYLLHRRTAFRDHAQPLCRVATWGGLICFGVYGWLNG